MVKACASEKKFRDWLLSMLSCPRTCVCSTNDNDDDDGRLPLLPFFLLAQVILELRKDKRFGMFKKIGIVS